ncbi:hypothetical protein [Haloferax sp. DFSO52]|uniref:hypothetical protein n=1 Tax=Haloferax sp. DFSO52 TaxID=3388505 RepID=UPI003A86C142
MSTHRPPARDFGKLFVELTGQTTLTHPQDMVASRAAELRDEDIEVAKDVASTVLETGMEDALESPEVD